jgi:hypothetical protein
MTKEQEEKIKEQFVSRCKALYIRYDTKAFYKEQASFFAGVMTSNYIVNSEHPNAGWSMYCMSDRSIVEPYKLS